MARQREHNYDVLRALSMLAIIVLHISGVWTSDMMTSVARGETDLWYPQLACVVNSLVRFAVPCFLMLSGAFLLGNPKNADYRSFYRKSLFRIVIPTLLFSAFYLVYQAVLLVWLGIGSPAQILDNALRGAPSYHLWYMYMLIVVYAFIPFLARFAQTVSNKTFCRVAAVYLVVAMTCRWMSGDPWANWDIGQGVEYAGYLMTGFAIARNVRKSNARAVLWLLAGLVLLLVTAWLEYRYQVMTGGARPGIWKNGVVEPFCLPVVVASVVVFTGFAKLDIRHGIRAVDVLSRLSFPIYRVHAFVLDLIQRLAVLAGAPVPSWNWLIGLPVLFVVVTAVSLALSWLYQRAYDRCVVRASA